MQRITLEEFRDAIQESTAPLVDGHLIPIVDGQALEIAGGKGYTGTPTIFWLWSKDDFDKYKEELEAAHGIKENT
jgi:hypothetical protein